MSDQIRVCIKHNMREDEDALLTRVPCVGEVVRYPSGKKIRRVRVLAVEHVEKGVCAAELAVTDSL